MKSSLWQPNGPAAKFITLGAVSMTAVLAQSSTLAASAATAPANPQSAPIQIYTSADENALAVGTLGGGENATPIAETQSAGGVRWYLIKNRSGVVGWIKQTDSEQAKKVESFFRSLPIEAAATSVVIPSVSSAAAPRGAIIVPVRPMGRSTIVSVIFNQSITGNLILDTGATNTVVSRRLAGLLSLHPVGNAAIQTVGGMIGATVARVQSLKVGDAEVTDLPVVIHDFSRDPRFEGLLGMDFLGRYTIGLDMQKQVLVLSPR